MTTVAYIPASAPFSIEQRAWLNGFFAGLLGPDPTPGTSKEPAPARPLLVLFGSQTGSAERLARAIAREATQHEFIPRVIEANACSAADLKTESRLLVVTSTWGEGDPPDNAMGFWSFLNSPEAPALGNLSYGVLALGDRNYSDFCGAGRKFDERLEKLGAKRIVPRTDCDLDFETPARAWTAALWKALSAEREPTVSNQPEAATASALIADAPVVGYSRKNPFPARLLANGKLNSEGSAKETRHFALSLAGSGLTYEAGDALGVMPTNCPALVGDIVSALGCKGEEAVKTAAGEETSLRDALLRRCAVSQVNRSFVEAIAERAKSGELKELLAPENEAALESHLRGRDVLDFILAHPAAKFAPGEFVALLRPLSPRLYSIASSPKAHPAEAHLCVGVVRFDSHGRSRKGVCSTFLADRVDGRTPVPLFVQSSPGFRLPASGDVPAIMVGPGTGIAPFRAFLQERRAIGARGRNWLFFGDQRGATDFLYREEIEAMAADDVLTRLDLAFSRDQEEKRYVQHCMVEHAAELFAWLEEGAHFFVCGDAKGMARDVDAALDAVIRKGGGRTAGQAMDYVARLKEQKRYKRDVY